MSMTQPIIPQVYIRSRYKVWNPTCLWSNISLGYSAFVHTSWCHLSREFDKKKFDPSSSYAAQAQGEREKKTFRSHFLMSLDSYVLTILLSLLLMLLRRRERGGSLDSYVRVRRKNFTIPPPNAAQAQGERARKNLPFTLPDVTRLECKRCIRNNFTIPPPHAARTQGESARENFDKHNH